MNFTAELLLNRLRDTAAGPLPLALLSDPLEQIARDDGAQKL